MAPRGESLDGRLARVEEAVAGFKEDRIEARQDRKDIISRLDAMTQTLMSTSAAVTHLSLEKCGERLDRLESSMDDVDARTKDVPALIRDFWFVRTLIGGGWRAFLTLGGGAAIAALVGAGVAHFIH
ncbi:MAG TPA: hypothetical protein VHW02_07950 [Rhizomicrobium sp.]|jgi:hypothetical protein|nr:hypothetical protein [Rhizomicrobium sp.]